MTTEAEPRGDLDPPERNLGGELNGAIARAVVRIYRQHAGRGPTTAQAFFRDKVVVVVLQSVMTQLERSIARGGRGDAVLALRRELHAAMRPELVATVEELTRRTVVSLSADMQVEPDVATEVFILDRPVDVEHATAARGASAELRTVP